MAKKKIPAGQFADTRQIPYERAKALRQAQNNIYDYGNALGVDRDDLAYLERQYFHAKKILQSKQSKMLAIFEVRTYHSIDFYRYLE